MSIPTKPLPNVGGSDTTEEPKVREALQELQQILSGGVEAANLASALQALLNHPGDIKATGRAAAPSGWLMCDGAAVSRTTYSDLFAAIGTAYGAGDGSTSFNLPDLRGRMPVGKGTHADVDALGENEGSGVGERRPKHFHKFIDAVAAVAGAPVMINPADALLDLAAFGSDFGHVDFNGNTTAQRSNSPGDAGVQAVGYYIHYTSSDQPAFQVVNWMVKT